jgi:hypothetical protein
MARPSAAVVALLALAAAAVETSRAAEPWIPVAELRGGWEELREMPEDASADPDLVRWGVHRRESRHYTRELAGVFEVCSVELWGFRSVGEAEAAHAGFAAPGWTILRTGTELVMLRGRSWTRGTTPRPGVTRSCRRIGDLMLDRAARSPAAGPRPESRPE